jgi:hypothetical protein
MDKKKIATKGSFLLLAMLALTPLADAEDNVLEELHLKNGASMRCDIVWKGLGNFVWCNQGGNVKGYPENDVDMEKTFEVQTRVDSRDEKSLSPLLK